MLRSNLSVVGKEVTLEASLVIMISLPYHSLPLGMSVTEVPVGVIINFEFSL
jgi:hypothetical protein